MNRVSRSSPTTECRCGSSWYSLTSEGHHYGIQHWRTRAQASALYSIHRLDVFDWKPRMTEGRWTSVVEMWTALANELRATDGSARKKTIYVAYPQYQYSSEP